MCGGGKLLQNTDCWAPGWAPPPPPPPRSSADVAQASAQRTFRRLRKAQDPRLNLGDFLLRAGTTGLRFVQWRPGSMASLEGQRSWCPHNPLTFSLCPRGQPRLSSIFQRFSAPGTGNFQDSIGAGSWPSPVVGRGRQPQPRPCFISWRRQMVSFLLWFK